MLIDWGTNMAGETHSGHLWSGSHEYKTWSEGRTDSPLNKNISGL